MISGKLWLMFFISALSLGCAVIADGKVGSGRAPVHLRATLNSDGVLTVAIKPSFLTHYYGDIGLMSVKYLWLRDDGVMVRQSCGTGIFDPVMLKCPLDRISSFEWTTYDHTIDTSGLSFPLKVEIELFVFSNRKYLKFCSNGQLNSSLFLEGELISGWIYVEDFNQLSEANRRQSSSIIRPKEWR